MKKKVLGLLSIIFVAVLLVACGKSTFEVSFDLDGGIATPAIEVQKVKEGGLVTKPADPTKDNHEFVHWALEDAEWVFATNKVTKKITLVAVWKVNEYTVTFETLGGAPVPEAQTVNHGAKAVVPATPPTLEANAFLGWYLNDAAYDFDTAVTASITLTAKWELNDYEVTFDAQGGTPAPAKQTITHNGKAVAPATNPAKEGYTFVAWTLDGENYDFNKAVTKAIVLVAQYAQNEYKVTFDAKGGTPTPAEQTITHGEKALEPAAPTHDATFIGWFLDGEEYDFNKEVTKAIVLVAKWEATVSFVEDDAIPPTEVKVIVGELVSKPLDPEKEYSDFLGWFYEGEEFDFSEPVEHNMSLQARFEYKYDEILANLEAHYADTLGNFEWNPTEDVVLLAEINGLPITWASSDETYFSNDGKVVIPSYSEGNQTIMLTASLNPIQSTMFFFIILAKEQTTEELIDEVLRVVTIVPSNPTGFQEQNFKVTETYVVGEEEISITWTTSDDTIMKANGELVAFEDAPSKEVTLTATITHNDVTKSKDIVFLVKGVSTYSSFKDALTAENENEKVKVEGVGFFSPIKHGSTSGGFYVASQDNLIAYVYGNVPENLKEDKLYDVLFTVQLYYGSFQLSSPAFVNERDGDIPEIVAETMTLEDIVSLPKPLTVPYNHTYIKLVNVKVLVTDPDDNYKTFFVNQDFDEETMTLNDENSIMVYYPSNLDVIRGLNGKRIDEIHLINNGYRTNNVVWYVNYVGDGSDIVMSELTDPESVIAAKEQAEGVVPFRVLANGKITLAEEAFGANLVWTTSDELVIDTEGNVTLPETAKEITLTATITKGSEELVFTRDVWVGEAAQLEADSIEDFLAYSGLSALMPFKLKGVITGILGDKSFSMYDGQFAVAVRTLSNTAVEVGFEYTVIGTRGVYNGLIQINQVGDAIKGDAKALEEPTTLTESNLKNNNFLLPLQSHLVTINGVEVTVVNKDSYNNVEVEFKLGTTTFKMKWDSRVTLSNEAKDLINGLKAGDMLNIVGAPLGWNNGILLGYNAASQLVIQHPENVTQMVDAAIANVVVPNATTTDLTLPTAGLHDVLVSWTSSAPAIIGVDGTVVIPENNTEVILTATYTLEGYSKVVTYAVLVQADETIVSVKIARTLAVDDAVKVEGIVTGMDPTRYVYISDADGTTIVLFNPTRADGLALGDKIVAEGVIDIYNNSIQLKAGATMTILSSGHLVPDAIEVDTIPEFLVADQGKRFSIDNLMVVSVNGRNLVLTDGVKNVTVYVDPNVAEITDHIATAVGKKVDLVEVHLGWHSSGGQFLIHSTYQAVIKDLDDADKALADLNAVVVPTLVITDDKLELPLKGSLYESSIVWSSSDALVIDSEGNVTLPAVEKEVTLTATATLGEEVVIKTFVVTVQSSGELVELTATMKYPAGIGSSNMGTDNQASVVGLDPNLFTVSANIGEAGTNVGINNAGQIRIYSVRATGNGNTLTVSIAAGSITAVVIKFTPTTGSTVQSTSGLLTLGTEEVVLNEADLTATQTYTDLDITEFSLLNNHMGGDKNGQIWITEIVITYLGTGGETPVDPDPDPEPAEVTTIADFLALNDGQTATIKGIITNVGPYNSFSIEDGTGAAAFRIGGKNAANIDFGVGDEVQADVKKATFNGLFQAELTGEYEVVSSNNVLPALLDLNEVSLEAADLLQYQSRIVKLDNMEVTNATIDGYGTVELTLKRADNSTINLRWDNRVVFDGSTTMKDFKVGDVVNIAGATLGWFNNPQLAVDNISQIVLVD